MRPTCHNGGGLRLVAHEAEGIRKKMNKVNTVLNTTASNEPAVPAQNVCVYCGSGNGSDPAYTTAARTLGHDLAKSGLGLVYGGGSLGLMGEVARATLDNGGHVTGIIPEFLSEKERMLRAVQVLQVVPDMHVRKRLMFERSDAFVALPGGIGTLEEIVEQLTWSQLGRHTKPIIIANIAGFWQPFLNLLKHMREETFIRAGLEVRFEVIDEASKIVPTLKSLLEKPTEKNSDPSLVDKL